jgi:hypothetical protein
MLQVTPFGDGIVLVHAMSELATLFPAGCKAGGGGGISHELDGSCSSSNAEFELAGESHAVASVGWDPAHAAQRTLRARDLASVSVPSLAHARCQYSYCCTSKASTKVQILTQS